MSLRVGLAMLVAFVMLALAGCKPVEIVLDPKVPLGDLKTHLSQSKAGAIQWHNKDNQAHTIKFVPGDWPFEGTQHDIPVDAHKKSEILKVSPTADKKEYDYTIDPKIVYPNPGTPPDGPAVIVDG